MIAPMEALAVIPEQLSPTETAPLMCAGITTYNALRNSGARVGDIVAILGMGGLGLLEFSLLPRWVLILIPLGQARDKERN